MKHLVAVSLSECKPTSIINAVIEGNCALLFLKLLRCYFALFNALTLFPLALNVSTRRLSFVLVALAGVSVSLLLLLDEISSLPSDTAKHLIRVLFVSESSVYPEVFTTHIARLIVV